MEVYLAVFDKSSFQISKALLGDVESYIDQHYVDANRIDRRRLLDMEKAALANPSIFLPSMAAAAPVEAIRRDRKRKGRHR